MSEGVMSERELAWETLRTHQDVAASEAALQALDRVYDDADAMEAERDALRSGGETLEREWRDIMNYFHADALRTLLDSVTCTGDPQ